MANYDITGSQPNNFIRPYTTRLTEHESDIATIILLSDNKPLNTGTFQINYLKDLSTKVQSISPATGKQIIGSPTNMTIPNLKLDGSHIYYGVFNNFSLFGVQESKQQLTKVHMNFGGSWNAFFFGEKPTVYAFNGVFLDSQEYPYYQEFMAAYDKFLSGRKCVENKFQMLVSYNGKIITGYMLDITAGSSASSPFLKTFVFSILVKDETWYRYNVIDRKDGSSIAGPNFLGNARINQQIPNPT